MHSKLLNKNSFRFKSQTLTRKNENDQQTPHWSGFGFLIDPKFGPKQTKSVNSQIGPVDRLKYISGNTFDHGSMTNVTTIRRNCDV